jgi:DNA-binding NarL/FixJ family response regulator
MAKQEKTIPAIDPNQVMLGLLAIQIAEREERIGDGSPRRTEVVLADAGLTLAEIAALTGKNYETVKTTVRRARQRTAQPAGRGRRTTRTEELQNAA